MGQNYQSGECLCGCGRKVINVTGLHAQCRKEKCRSCGEPFKWKGVHRISCSKCLRKVTHTNFKYVSQMGVA